MPLSFEEKIGQAHFTILLGKNGSGKSTLLRHVARGNQAHIKYVSPERGGTLKYDPNVDTNIANNENWLRDTRNKNRYEQFREQSAAQFRMLELLILREIEIDPAKRADPAFNFEAMILSRINALLPAIRIARSDRGFSIRSSVNAAIPEDQISSGEAELIALAIEVLVFSRSDSENKLLLLDEPDVHLHPDLQHRFVEFLQGVAEEKDIRVVIATHSTAIVGAFSSNSDLQIVPISRRDQDDFPSFRRSKVVDEILPVFGVHPLSNAFNKAPVVLVEGDDDKRVLEQVVRTGAGRYSWTPCPVGGVAEISTWESWLNLTLPAIYDSPRAFSLRDLDDSPSPDLDDDGIICRIRLNCCAIENILLTDQCFASCDLGARDFLDRLTEWVSEKADHKYIADAESLLHSFEERRVQKIKNLRNIILALLGTNKPWEVVVGQLIAEHGHQEGDGSEHSIQNYLGKKARTELFNAK